MKILVLLRGFTNFVQEPVQVQSIQFILEAAQLVPIMVLREVLVMVVEPTVVSHALVQRHFKFKILL